MKNSDAPEYLRDLTREERALICKYRMMSEEEQRHLLEKTDEYIKSNLQSIAKTDNK